MHVVATCQGFQEGTFSKTSSVILSLEQCDEGETYCANCSAEPASADRSDSACQESASPATAGIPTHQEKPFCRLYLFIY